MRSGSKNMELDTNTKEAVLDAALDLFAHNGFGGARMEAIAKSAGTSYGVVYYHYSSKDALYHMVVQRAMEQCVDLYGKALTIPDGSAYERLRKCACAFLDWSETEKGSQSLLLLYDVLTAKNIPAVTRIYIREKFQMIVQNLTQIMDGLHEEGHALDKTSEELAGVFNVLMIGGAFLKIAKISPLIGINTFLSPFL